MKRKRQGKILELVRDNCIETQDELLALLSADGFSVTQATISRDIKDLHLIKVSGSDGRYRYTASKAENADISSKFYSMFADAVEDVDVGQNIVCIKCFSGMAQAVCASMDTIDFEGVVGTLAGEDTIFVLCRSNEQAASLRSDLLKLL